MYITVQPTVIEIVSIPYRYGTTRGQTEADLDSAEEKKQVSIPYRYGTTTVFATFCLAVVV